jgi:hypothetical protein
VGGSVRIEGVEELEGGGDRGVHFDGEDKSKEVVIGVSGGMHQSELRFGSTEALGVKGKVGNGFEGDEKREAQALYVGGSRNTVQGVHGQENRRDGEVSGAEKRVGDGGEVGFANRDDNCVEQFCACGKKSGAFFGRTVVNAALRIGSARIQSGGFREGRARNGNGVQRVRDVGMQRVRCILKVGHDKRHAAGNMV